MRITEQCPNSFDHQILITRLKTQQVFPNKKTTYISTSNLASDVTHLFKITSTQNILVNFFLTINMFLKLTKYFKRIHKVIISNHQNQKIKRIHKSKTNHRNRNEYKTNLLLAKLKKQYHSIYKCLRHLSNK